MEEEKGSVFVGLFPGITPSHYPSYPRVQILSARRPASLSLSLCISVRPPDEGERPFRELGESGLLLSPVSLPPLSGGRKRVSLLSAADSTRCTFPGSSHRGPAVQRVARGRRLSECRHGKQFPGPKMENWVQLGPSSRQFGLLMISDSQGL